MGLMGSYLSSKSHPRSNSTDCVVENVVEHYDYGILPEGFFEEHITEDLLIEILSHMSETDLLLNCRFVSRQWLAIVDSQSVWRLKCEREHVKVPIPKVPELPKHHYQYLYLFSHIRNKNFVSNPCGEEGLKSWESTDAFNFRFCIENPPQGADPVPEEVGSRSCFATTYTECRKFQIINLAEGDIRKYLLEHDLVTIKVGEWYAARFDCASVYELQVVLYDNTKEVIDQFEFRHVEEQWTGREWNLVTHEFQNVKNVCYVGFQHMGCDRQYWAGYYGSKMTGGFVKLCLK